MTIVEYAEAHGISERTVRRRIQRGQLRAVLVAGPYGPEYRIVEDASPDGDTADEAPQTRRPPSPAADETDSLDTANTWPDTLDSFLALVRDQQQTIIELSGRCGWLQSENQRLREEVRLLSAPSVENLQSSVSLLNNDPAAAPTSNHPAASPNGPVRGAESPPRRPWWRFWRWLET